MAVVYVPDTALLVAQLRRDFMPESALDFVDNLTSSRKIKIWRTVYPDKMTILDMVAVAQNTPAWMGFRDGSFGGSGYAAIAGYDDYKDNIDQWRLETGQVRGRVAGTCAAPCFIRFATRGLLVPAPSPFHPHPMGEDLSCLIWWGYGRKNRRAKRAGADGAREHESEANMRAMLTA